MVVLSQKNPDDSNQDPSFTPDAPPAYEDLVSNRDASTFATLRLGDEKRRSTGSTTAVSDGEGAGSDTRRASGSYNISPTQAQAKATRSIGINKTWFSWFSEKDTRKEVKQTIQSLIKDVVKDPTSPTAASVLQSCLEACQSRGLSFQSIISEKFMEGHSPIYWAIAKRKAKTSEPGTGTASDSESPGQDPGSGEDRVELLDILLSMPLNSTTRLEAYSACLLTSDNALFQRLRNVPDEQAYSSPGGNASISPDELLLGEAPGDKIQVFDGDADYGEFKIIWDVAHFQKRMRAIGSVNIQVVARGHIWHLAFTILQKDTYKDASLIKAGSWIVCVSLVEPSPASHLYAQIRIPEPSERKQKTQRKSSIPDSDESNGSAKSGSTVSMPKIGRKSLWNNASKPTGSSCGIGGSKPPITLSLSTDSGAVDNVLEPVPLSASKNPQFARGKSLVAVLDKHQNGHGLQFDGSSYLNNEGTLRVIFEASLSKRNSGNDCIIC